MQFRHEWKHEISPSDMIVLRSRLSEVMKPDEHAEGGKYLIRSLYFDTPEDTALREKLDGINCREKFRIRLYNGDTGLIHLEKKAKNNGLGSKESAELTADQVQRLVVGELDWMMDSESPLVRELYTKMKNTGLRPRTIVDYTREAFTYGPGNVRVTLDYDIRTGLGSTDVLNPHCPTIPVPGSPIILEVKWDAYLPDLVRDVIQLEGRHTAPYSKYASCRSYD